MKKLIILLFCAQLISLTQTAQVKKATDACPGANKNNRTSNDYASLSKRSSAKSTSDFSKPKYQSIYTKNTNSSSSTRGGKASAVKRTPTPVAERTETVAKKEKAPVVVPEEKNTSSKSEREPEPEFKAEEPKSVEAEKKEVKPASPSEGEEVKSAPATESTKKEKGKTVSSKKSKKSLETTTDPNSKTKQQQKYRAKKIKCGKGGATDCPQF